MMDREAKREAAIERSIYASDLLIQPETWSAPPFEQEAV